MKKVGTKIVIVILLISCLVIIPACGRDEPPDTGTLPIITTSVQVETTVDEAVAVSVDPITAASRGLDFSSNNDGTCTLISIGTCVDMCLIIPDKSDSGDKVTKIASAAFAGNSTITAVQIPACVIEIGTGAFAGCAKLAYISVADGNTAYLDAGGILYSADGNTLICVPAGSSYISLTLTKKVIKIADSATCGCTMLKKILYEGSSDEWKLVTVGEGNSVIISAEFTFMTQTGK